MLSPQLRQFRSLRGLLALRNDNQDSALGKASQEDLYGEDQEGQPEAVEAGPENFGAGQKSGGEDESQKLAVADATS